MKTQLTATAILAAALAGSLGYWTGTEYEQVEVVEPLPPEAVELKTADADALEAELPVASATCTLQTLYRPVGKDAAGEWVTEPFESCYCLDGKGFGKSVEVDECPGGEVTVSGGKVFVKEQADGARVR